MARCDDDPSAGRVSRLLKRVVFDRPHATRFRLLFMHVVIAKPLHTLGSGPEGMLLRDMH
ncbi:hypothetical protein MES5069_750019 [Mesorhizobium escarrei]|uniref:Uncharacterized protein n=1 Tax=Mesorhizobium escarrei TaxID=666018 RepID=A0ABM9EI13_9HYPH|nr:hypothetical protein MES5069_750019 [Mesorhizobium escarrei]